MINNNKKKKKKKKKNKNSSNNNNNSNNNNKNNNYDVVIPWGYTWRSIIRFSDNVTIFRYSRTQPIRVIIKLRVLSQVHAVLYTKHLLATLLSKCWNCCVYLLACVDCRKSVLIVLSIMLHFYLALHWIYMPLAKLFTSCSTSSDKQLSWGLGICCTGVHNVWRRRESTE